SAPGRQALLSAEVLDDRFLSPVFAVMVCCLASARVSHSDARAFLRALARVARKTDSALAVGQPRVFAFALIGKCLRNPRLPASLLVGVEFYAVDRFHDIADS